MNHSPETPAAAREQVPTDLVQLTEAIASLPEPYAAQLSPLVDAVVESTKRRRRILTLVQDALSQLRLDMKYLMFDLEATRRERDEYRAQLED
ncbi:MAG: transcriptional regulator [Planctomycetaceae bacterium]|nr:transcriptional regulator [Planctomycetaceae bacterium]